MSSPKIVLTVVDIVKTVIPSSLRTALASSRNGSLSPARANEIDPELRLPKHLSLVIVLVAAALFQLTFFIIVSSSNVYAQALGGTATFSGLVIGIPTVASGLALIPLIRLDQEKYTRPLHIACAAALLGNIFYALAYRANYLYLILIGRIVTGIAFTSFMYSKRYCSDPRTVGIRRRTTLAGWLVVTQGFGFSAGPFLGGLLYKVGFPNTVFNGYTSPGWVMAAIWTIFWVIATLLFEDVPDVAMQTSTTVELYAVTPPDGAAENSNASASPSLLPLSRVSSPVLSPSEDENHYVNARQWGVIVCMCWYAMTCFFILGGWEANLPIFTGVIFGYSPFAAGNFIAAGGIATIPVLFLNVWFAKRVQDRQILSFGAASGLTGLLIMLVIVHTNRITFGSLYICWFLVALGFNLASTVTLSLLTKQLPGEWNGRISMAIQYSNYLGRVTGAVWGGAGVHVGMMNYVGLQIAIVGIGGLMHLTLWRELKAKTG